MTTIQARIHDQIVELITRAHTSSQPIETRIQSLQQATELLLFHTAGNERVDEFLETFLSMHVNREVALRRFCAHFIELLCFTRSRFACSCLEVLVTLLQDSDKQVQIFALRAARVTYKRAIYWISIQQREPMFVQAARESVDALDHVLARIVHLITASSREVFSESIRCSQSIILCQSFSNFAAKSQAQLEAVGASCLEDLKLVDAAALEESKLKGQADRLFAALCALLVKKREANASQMEVISLINAVGVIGHDRGSYAGAATVAFTELVDEMQREKRGESERLNRAIVNGLKRILASRHCVEWQPQIIPVLKRLGIIESQSTDMVMQAEVERMRQQVELSSEQLNVKRRKTTDSEGERLMMISDLADHFKVPDEDHAVGVCSVRAQSPAELAKLALAMLGRLPKSLEDPRMALVKVNRASGTGSGHSLSFENRVRAVRAMDMRTEDFMESTNMDEEDVVNEPPRKSYAKKVVSDATMEPENQPEMLDMKSLIDVSQIDFFCKMAIGLKINKNDKIQLIQRYIAHHVERPGECQPALNKLMLAVCARDNDVSIDEVGAILVGTVRSSQLGFNEIKAIFLELPIVPTTLLDFIDSQIANVEIDVGTRRNALTTLSGLLFSKPGMARDLLGRLVRHCASVNDGVRNDALKLVLAKIYKPLPAICLKWQWPYNESCPLEMIESTEGRLSKMELLCSQTVEEVGVQRVMEAVNEKAWAKAWLGLALCSKKPILIHSIMATFIEAGDISIPGDMMTAFGQTIASIPAIDGEIESLVKHYKSVRSASKKKTRNDFLLPILSAISNTDRGLTSTLADAALSFNK